MLINTTVFARDVKPGMLLNCTAVVESTSYSGGYVFNTSEGKTSPLDGMSRVDVYIPVPEDYVDWGDDAIHGCNNLSTDQFTLDADTATYRISKPDGMYIIRGYCDDDMLRNWPGVGYSAIQFSMKCLIKDGVLYRPGGPDTRISDGHHVYNAAILHRNWWYGIGK